MLSKNAGSGLLRVRRNRAVLLYKFLDVDVLYDIFAAIRIP
jgi:hypothetical protein